MDTNQADGLTQQGEPPHQIEPQKTVGISPQTLQSIFEAMAGGFGLADISGKIVFINREVERVLNVSKEQIIGEVINTSNWGQIKDEQGEPLPAERLPLSIALREQRKVEGMELQVTAADGQTRWLSVDAAPLVDEHKLVCGAAVNFRDITELKQIKIELQKNKSFLTSFLENTPISMYLVSLQGELLQVNHQWEAERGLARKDVLGLKLAEIFPLETARQFMQDCQTVIETRSRLHQCETMQDPDGRHLYETIKFPLFAPNGEIEAIGGIFIDVTENNQNVEELIHSRNQLRDLSQYLQTAREKERQSVAREIHDELGQELTTIKLDINWIKKHLPPGDLKIIEKINATTQLVDNTIQSIRRIATELRPGLLDDLGLVATLEWQIDNFTRHTGIQCEFVAIKKLPAFNTDISTVLFRISQEALTNISRHARATKVIVKLTAKMDIVTLSIHDNGKGIRPGELNNGQALGLLGMRERALSVGGTVTIKGEPHKGTSVIVRIPLPEKQAHHD